MDPDRDFRFSPRPNRAHEIAWRPWGPAAFAEARKLRRPVLLSLSAVWCHWCHVMDETSYSDERAIAQINEQFLPVRVDNDRHPEVNRRYNMGGWPTTAFLTPTGHVLTGATYLPPGQLRQALTRVREFFDTNQKELLSDAPAPEASPPTVHGPEDVTLSHVPLQVAMSVVHAFDPLHGGLGAAPKFPQPDAFALLLAVLAHRPASTEAQRLREVLDTTLAAMASGGLADHVGGGFYRYSTERDWSVPHYEKMLEDNARLALLYLDAAALAAAERGREAAAAEYRRTAQDVLAYLLGTLWRGDPPAFGGSQDADEQYSTLDAEGRASLAPPFVDPTVYVDWNALAARALLRGAAVLGRDDLRAHGLALLDWLADTTRRQGHQGFAHYVLPDGTVADGAPLLADQASLAAAQLDAYQVTGERRWLEGAEALAGWAGERFRAQDGRLDDRAGSEGDEAGLLAVPAPALEDNALLADALLRVAELTGDDGYREQALGVLASWIPFYEQYGVGAAPYAVAVLRAEDHAEQVLVVGGRDDGPTRRLHATALAASRPLRSVQLLDPSDPSDAGRMAGLGLAPAVAPAAFVCRNRACQAPVSDPEELARLLAAPAPGA
jgi:uncharacterized protein YyaL (SSP411 family)